MNQLLCPGCGKAVCDFVIYCPYCGFAVQDYLEQQTAQQAEAFFADMLPIAQETEEEIPVQEKPARRLKNKAVIPLLLLALVFLGLSVGMTTYFTMNRTVPVPAFEAPVIVEKNYYSKDVYDYTLQSEVTTPFAAVYQGLTDTPASCIYMNEGKGTYTGAALGEPIGYLAVDSSVHMKTINTTYQYYALSDDEIVCLVNFDITFDQNVCGLFLYDLRYNYDNRHTSGCSVSVMNGQTRIVEVITELPETIALEAHLTPKGFVNTQEAVVRTGERIWGSDVEFYANDADAEDADFSYDDSLSSDRFSSVFCSQLYYLPITLSDLEHTLILYRYTVESGGNQFELGRSTYYMVYAGRQEKNLAHYQTFYGEPVAKPTYTRDIIGFLTVQPFTPQASS